MSRAPSLSSEGLRQLLRPRGPARPRLDFEHARSAGGTLGIALLCAGVLACAGLLARVQWLKQDLQRLEASVPARQAAAASPHNGAAISGAGLSKALSQRAEQANAVVARLSMPWDDWFRQLETAAKGKVVLTALQPEADGRRVRIAGEARRFDDLVEYMMRLEATPGFANVYLGEHAEVAPGVSFTLSADWVGGP